MEQLCHGPLALSGALGSDGAVNRACAGAPGLAAGSAARVAPGGRRLLLAVSGNKENLKSPDLLPYWRL